MLPNPYSPGETPRYLAGRTAELQTISDYLAPVVAFGHMAGPQLVCRGPRGIGKTSLMNVAKDQAREAGFIVAWTSCRQRQPFLADLAHTVERALRRADIEPAADRWSAVVERVAVEVSVPAIANLGVAIDRGRRDATAEPTPGAISAVEDFLHEASRAAAGAGTRRRGIGLLVVIDELHAGSPGELAVLLNAVQNLTHERQENPLAVIGAGLPSIGGTLTAAATFGERSRWITLSELEESELVDALVAPARELGVTWSPDAVAAALQASQHYPHFLQLMGSATWLATRPEAGTTIGLAEARAGLPTGLSEVRDLYAARWGAATEMERRLITTMAVLAPGDEPVVRRDIEAALGQSISAHRQRLLDKAVIEDVDRGELKFTLPGFAAFVLDEAGPGYRDP